tara:strand:+ start:306 stop:518 length:213 start_codon:yes stop_codon:yes gene_type:complete
MRIKFKVGTGILDKDGEEPLTLSTIHCVDDKWKFPVAYTVKNLVNGLMDATVKSIDVVDEDNKQVTIEKA